MMAERNRPIEPDECGRFYDEHQFWLRCVIRKAVGSNGDVEDILQSFMLRLMDKPVPEVFTEKRYCYKMLKNFIIDAKRNGIVYEKHISNFAQVHAWSETYNPWEKLSKKDEYHFILKKAIRLLPERIALAVKLRLRREYTVEKIATKMSIDKKTAIKYVSDGKSMLREMLSKKINSLCFLSLIFNRI
ncbi:MAG: hypothetical protein A2Y12_06375 [Planctomycetes bacterium GWF2_42_9]|nr:MAG: hypothetical protein A2Y12_06375 [Planctomycetes bacterium GWF2_42_9]